MKQLLLNNVHGERSQHFKPLSLSFFCVAFSTNVLFDMTSVAPAQQKIDQATKRKA